MIRHVSCHVILGATQEEADRLYPDGSCIGYCPNEHCSHGLFGIDQGDGTYDDTFVSAEALRREREEIVKMVEGMKIEGRALQDIKKDGCGWMTTQLKPEDHLFNQFLQDVINAIKERK